MASSIAFYEFNGWTGSTFASNTTSPTNIDFKANDSANTTSSTLDIPVTIGSNSMTKQLCIQHSGTYNTLSSASYAFNTAAPATGVSIYGHLANSYTQPSTTTLSSAWSTQTVAYVSGSASSGVAFTNSGTTPWTSANATVCTQAIIIQLVTTSSAVGLISGSVTLTYQWSET